MVKHGARRHEASPLSSKAKHLGKPPAGQFTHSKFNRARKEDLRRWRDTFAERLRGWGIEAEATSQTVRGSRHREQRAWSRDTGESRPASVSMQRSPKMSPSHRRAGEAWVRIAQTLAASMEPGDHELSDAIVRYVRQMPVMRDALARAAAQRELPGMTRSPSVQVTPTRRGPEMER